MILVYVLQTVLPSVLILWLAALPPRNRAGFWVLALAAALMTFASTRLGIWVFPPWWVPDLLAVLLVGAVGMGLLLSEPLPCLPARPIGWGFLAIFAVTAGYAAVQSQAAVLAARMPDGPSIDLAWPLGPGRYIVANGGATATINAHAGLLDPALPLHAGFGGSSFGVDLIAVNAWGLRASGIMPGDPESYLIFGMPVLAPCAGQIILAEGNRPDMPVPEVDGGHPAGNHVLLRCADVDILMGHFRQGSLRVAVGDSVAIGQRIAEVGNSGETSEPHLHIHAQMPGLPEAPFGGQPVAMRFGERFLVRGDRVDLSVSAP